MKLTALQADALRHSGVRHAFFTRGGGASEGVYATLNGGVGSKDAPERVAENRRRMAQSLNCAPERLLVPYQIHSALCQIVDRPWTDRPQCDALATKTPGLALGVTGADCGMALFMDVEAGVIGAAHAGWKGALGGVIEATLAAMGRLGARTAAIRVALGPMIAQDSYEVGPEFVEQFCASDHSYASFFKPSPTPWPTSATSSGHSLFNLPAFIKARALGAGVASFEDLGLDTYSDAERFFSYRRATHRKEADYGRLVSAIMIEP